MFSLNRLGPSKKFIGLTIFKTTVILIIISALYYLFFVKPLKDARTSLSEAKNFTGQLKLINSQNSITFTELYAINPSHPSYNELISQAFANYEETDKKFSEINKEFLDSKFGGTKEVRNFLNNEFREKYRQLLSDFAKVNNQKKDSLSGYKEIIPALSKVTGYNPHTDIGNLDLSSDMESEAALIRSESAIGGIEKAVSTLKDITNPTPDMQQLISLLEESLASLKAFRRDLESGDVQSADSTRQTFLAGYGEVFNAGSNILRTEFNLPSATSSHEEINIKLDDLLISIEKEQKNLPTDPLKIN